jgi:hypothetical protein
MIGNNANIKMSSDGGGTYPTLLGTVPVTDKSFQWTVTGAQIGGNKIRVGIVGDEELAATDAGGTGGASPAFEVIPFLKLTYPTDTGLKFHTGDVLYIKWTPDPADFGGGGQVNIRYDTNEGANYNGIVVPNDDPVASNNDPGGGIGYKWTIPDNFSVTSNKMRIKVYKTGQSYVSSASGENFQIGKITVGQPDGSQSWKILQTNLYNVTWTAGGMDNVKIYYSTQDGAAGTYQPIQPSNQAAASAGTLRWDTPDAVSNTVRVKVIDALETDVDNAFYGATSAQLKLIEEFTNIQPSNGQNLTAGDATSITWSKLGNSLANVKLYLSKDNGDNYTLIKETLNTGSASWNVPTDVRSILCKIRVVSSINSDNSAASNGDFVIKNKITVTNPTTGTPPWNVGSTYPIQWTYEGPDQGVKVKIEYSPTGQVGNFATMTRSSPRSARYASPIPASRPRPAPPRATSPYEAM